MFQKPRVGVAVLMIHRSRLLLGRRLKSPGKDSWQCPGGFLKPGEDILDCARRELQEETGLFAEVLDYGPYTNNLFSDEGIHTVTLYVVAKYINGTPQVLESGSADWDWYALDQLPQPLFLPLDLLLRDHYDWLVSSFVQG